LLAVLSVTVGGPANAALNFTDVTLFAVVRDGIKYGEQDSQPLLIESVPPTPGNPWDWQVSGMSGFAPTANITFTYENDGVGQPNELHTEATMTWSGFQDSEWANGNSGSFTLTLTNGVDPDRNYTINLALRSLPSIEFTVIEDQSQAETDPICASPASGSPYTWSASGVSGIAPVPTISFTFDGGDTDRKNGRVAVSFAGDWSNQNGYFTLSLGDGSRPESIFDGSRAGAGASLPSLSLRRLNGDGYTVIQNQTSGGDGVSAAGANGFTFSASGFSGLSPAPTTLTFDAMGAVTACSCANWNQDGTFTLTVQDGTRPGSIINGRALTLRQLIADGYTVIQNQTSGGDGVNAAGANGFTFSASGFSGLSPAPTTLTFDAMGAVTACSCANWNQDGTFTLTVQDGTRPGSIINGRALTLRQIIPDPLTIPNDGNAGSTDIEVAGDAGPWDWSDYSDGLANSALTAPDTPSSATLTIGWGAGDLYESGESGTGSLTIQESGGPRPSSTVDIPTIVEGAVAIASAFPSPLVFVEVPGNQTTCDTIYVANFGGATCTISGIYGCSTAPFSMDTTMTAHVLAPGDTTEIVVCVTPTVAGPDTAGVTIVSDASNSPTTVQVRIDVVTAIEPDRIPKPFRIVSVSPNPFNPSTTVHFTLPTALPVTAVIWSVTGARVRVLANEQLFGPGDNRLIWDGRTDQGSRAASGVYFVRVETRLGGKVARAVMLK
jgi:hypothetical protein